MEAGVEEKEGRGTRMEGEEPGGVDLEWRSDGDKAAEGRIEKLQDDRRKGSEGFGKEEKREETYGHE